MVRSIVAILLVISAPVLGQKQDFQNFTMDEGMSSSTVYCVTQDVQGKLWFGTDRGVNTYDAELSKHSHWRTAYQIQRYSRFNLIPMGHFGF